MPKIHQKITTFLWFDTQAEEAARYYTSIFPDSRIVATSHYPDAVPDKAGTVMMVKFELAGQQFHALNAGPQNKFTEAVSLLIECEDQAEVDEYWTKLTANGGEESPCGWLQDRYGLSWQVTPARLLEFVTGDDPKAASAAMSAMFEMKKIVIADIEKAVKAVQS